MEFDPIKLIENLNYYIRLYEEARTEYAEAKYYLDVLLASRLPDFRRIRSNIGYDSGLLMLLEDATEETKNAYRIVTLEKYKIYEKFIEKTKEEINLYKHQNRMAQG